MRGLLVVWKHRLASAALYVEERRALLAQVEALVAEHQPQWLAGYDIPHRATFSWHCGFVTGMWHPWNEGAPTRLNLAGNELGAEGARVLAASQAFGALVWLRLRDNGIAPDDASALCAAGTASGGQVYV